MTGNIWLRSVHGRERKLLLVIAQGIMPASADAQSAKSKVTTANN
jgi:hypothetical protein